MTTIFERLVQESPVALMVRATLERAFAPEELDGLFAPTAQQQYARCCFPPWSS